MSPDDYRQRIAALGLTQEEAGRILGASDRTGQRWAADGPPLAVSMVLLAVGTNQKTFNNLLKKAIKLRR